MLPRRRGAGSPASRRAVRVPPDPAIPAAVLADLWGMEAADAEEDVLRPLENLCLLQWTPESGAFRLHAMVSEALADARPRGDRHRRRASTSDRRLGRSAPAAARLRVALVRLALQPREGICPARTLLLDLPWLEAKLAATGVDALVREFDYCEKDPVLTRLQATIRLSAHIVAADPLQLPAQLLARIPEDDGELRARLIEQARTIDMTGCIRSDRR